MNKYALCSVHQVYVIFVSVYNIYIYTFPGLDVPRFGNKEIGS